MQNLQLLLHIPDLASLDAQTAVSWCLFDRKSNLLREGISQLMPTGQVPRAERTVIVIPARRVVYIETPLPPVSTAKRDALLRYAIEDKLTIDPATVHAVVLGTSASLKPSMPVTTHVVTAIDRAWFASVLRWLRDAGIEPAQAVSAAALIPVASGEWGVVLDGAHGLARRADGFAYSFDIERTQTTGVPLTPPFALALALKEARDHQCSPTQLTVFIDQPADAPWIAAWQRALDCPVRISARPAPRMVTSSAGNLLAGDFAPRSTGNEWMAMLKPAIAAVALIAILQLGFTVIDAWRLDQRRRSLENEMTQVFKTAFPNAQAIVDPPLQMQRNLESMKRERGLSSSDDVRVLIAGLTAILKSVPNLLPQRITISEGAVTLLAAVPDPQQQAALRSRTTETRGATFNVDAENIVRLTLNAAR